MSLIRSQPQAIGKNCILEKNEIFVLTYKDDFFSLYAALPEVIIVEYFYRESKKPHKTKGIHRRQF